MCMMVRCMVAVLVVSSFSLTAFGDPPIPPVPVDPQWGPNVVVTCALTDGYLTDPGAQGVIKNRQTFDDLFSKKTTVKELVQQWAETLEHVPNYASIPAADQIKEILAQLIKAINADPKIEAWTARDVIVKKWNDLDGDKALKGTVRSWFGFLQMAGMMSLSFMARPEDAAPSDELLDTLDRFEKHHPLLLKFTTKMLYEEPSGKHDCDEITIVSFAMDSVKLIRTEPPNGPKIKGVGCCSRLTRQCTTGSGNCTPCAGGSCCLGSTWCP